MDATQFDRVTRQISRRGIAALLGVGLLSGRDASAAGTCGGTPNTFTQHCKHAGGSCQTDADCVGGCVCVERRQGCCYRVRKKRRKGPGKRICIDGAPGLFCTPAGEA